MPFSSVPLCVGPAVPRQWHPSNQVPRPPGVPPGAVHMGQGLFMEPVMQSFSEPPPGGPGINYFHMGRS